ncbi:hypothetical protein Cgig2_016149 [Carnegiea gigantea]|uniref:dihydropyrimidinase n=1 Tax=Carnegiea gigantea TaxID=171969 RepID=A0A9Q1KNL6_9CARY|nr:hypothetical protein Cgig2_016149 [Carnegiea gigantea]
MQKGCAASNGYFQGKSYFHGPHCPRSFSGQLELKCANGDKRANPDSKTDGSVNSEKLAFSNECCGRPVHQGNYYFGSAFSSNLLKEMHGQAHHFDGCVYPANHGQYFPTHWFRQVPFQVLPQSYPPEYVFQDFQYFVVIDFEATCDKEKTPQPQEIIEFPSVLVNSRTGQLEDCFQIYVRPTHNQLLTEFCKDLTGIQQSQECIPGALSPSLPSSKLAHELALGLGLSSWLSSSFRVGETEPKAIRPTLARACHEVDEGVLLSEALLMHDKWLEDKGIKHTNFAIVTWSNWDCRVMLESECRFKRITKPPYFNRWINLKVPFCEVFGGVRCNLKEAVELAGLAWQGRPHCGLDDAKNTARLVAHLMHRGLKLSITSSIFWQSADHSHFMHQQSQQIPSPPEYGLPYQPHKWKKAPTFITAFPFQPSNPMKEPHVFCYCGATSVKRVIRKPGPQHGSFFFGCGNWTANREVCGLSSSSLFLPCFAEMTTLLVLVTLLCIAFSATATATAQFCEVGSDPSGYGEYGCQVSSSPSSSRKILIKGGTVVNAHHQEVADVYVEDGIIVAVQPNIKVGDDVTVVDATGKYVMPGGIDPHAHLAMEALGTETVDDFFSGQAAALAGGTTMHIDFVIPVNGSLTAGLESYKRKAQKSCMDYGFHMAITKWNEEVSREMEIMVKEEGINSFKFFMAYKGILMVKDELMIEGFKKCKSLGALPMVHAENGDAVFEGQQRMIELGITGPEGHALSRPPVLEGEATARAIRLARFVGTPLYVVHVMSIDAMEEIAKARKSVVVHQYINLCILIRYVMSPPIRAAGHDKALQAALSAGVLQLVGTDHCAWNSTQKAQGIDDFRILLNGVNGIEERMHLVWNTMVGKVEVTIAGGRIVWENGELKAVPGTGKYVKMPRFSYVFDGIDKADSNYLASLRAPGKVVVTIGGGTIVWENGELKAVPGTGKNLRASSKHLFSSSCCSSMEMVNPLLLAIFAAFSLLSATVTAQFCEAGIEYGETGCQVSSSPSSSRKILIKGGTVVNAHHQEVADVYVEDGIISAVQRNIKVGDDVTVLDATGKYVMPGGIDPHTHLEMEFMGTEAIDDFFSGQAAALAGGTTMHIDFVIPVNGSLTAGLESYKQKAQKSCMDYGFHMAITKWDDDVSREMEIMVKEEGINSFKFFMAYKGSLMINDDLLIEGFKKCKSLGALAMVHAENGDAVFEGQKRMIELGITGPEGHALSRPPLLEAEATARAIRLARFVNTPLYVVHVMSIDAMEEIAKARKSDGKLEGLSCYSPIPGLEERMHLIWDTMLESGHISVTDYVRITSTECAKIFNIYPRKGAILPGSDADIIIFNPNSSFTISAQSHHSRSDTNVYEGVKGKGKVEVTIAGGRIVWENGLLKAVPGSGKYVEMAPFSYVFDGIDKADSNYLASLRAPVKRFKSST